MTKLERILLIKELRSNFKTYQEIGTILGLTRQRVEQLCKQFNISKPTKEVVFVSPQMKYQERIKKYSTVSETACWEWTASRIPQGYGRLCYKGDSSEYAHRVSYLVFKGEIPSGMCVLHTCDNPGCVNPDHLWLGTHQQNMDDRNQKGRCRKATVK